MQNDSTNHLDIEMTQANCPFGGLPDGCESLRQNLVQRFLLRPELLFLLQAFRVADTLGYLFPELICFPAKRFVAQRFELRLELIDLLDNGPDVLDGSFVGVSPEEFDKTFKHNFPFQ